MTDVQKKRIEKWCEALESGEFKQTRNRLHNPKTGGYCCLGVACELYRRDARSGEWGGTGEFFVEERYEDCELPDTVKDWFGLPAADPCFGGTWLTTRNDDGKRFKTIAKAIRKEYLS